MTKKRSREIADEDSCLQDRCYFRLCCVVPGALFCVIVSIRNRNGDCFENNLTNSGTGFVSTDVINVGDRIQRNSIQSHWIVRDKICGIFSRSSAIDAVDIFKANGSQKL